MPWANPYQRRKFPPGSSRPCRRCGEPIVLRDEGEGRQREICDGCVPASERRKRANRKGVLNRRGGDTVS